LRDVLFYFIYLFIYETQSGPHLYQFHVMILSWKTTHTMKIC